MLAGRFFNGTEVQYRKNVVVLGNTAYQLLFAPNGMDPVGKMRAGRQRAIRSRRRLRQAAGGRRLQPRPGRLRRHPVHGLPADLRAQPGPDQQERDVPADSDFAGAARRRQPGGSDRGRRARHADPARAEAGPAQRFRPADPGRVPQVVGPDQPGHVLRAGRHLVDRADGRRHRRDGDHVDLGHRTDARDRRAQGARRAAGGDPVSVPDGGGVPDVGRRRHRHRRSAPASAGPCTSSPASRFRCRGGRSPSASASRPRSASSSACIPPSKRPASTQSKRCATNSAPRLADLSRAHSLACGPSNAAAYDPPSVPCSPRGSST